MDLIRHIKHLNGKTDWPIWKHEIRDLLDYHEEALEVIDGKLVLPVHSGLCAKSEELKIYEEKADLFRKANSYAKSMITSAVSDVVYQKIMDKKSAREVRVFLNQEFEASSQDQDFIYIPNSSHSSGPIAISNSMTLPDHKPHQTVTR